MPAPTQYQFSHPVLAHQISALLDALDAYEGAVVVISHDRPFCEAVRCTHVAYVSSGRITLDERSLRDSDFTVADRGVANVAPGTVVAVEERQAAAEDKAQAKEVTKLDRNQQKARGNAPKKIKTIEKKVR
jgi:ABC-type multidrug transport system ATPase subunit